MDDRASGTKEIKNILAALKRMRARCISEKRNPTPGEKQAISARMARVDELSKEMDLMDKKLAMQTAKAFAARLERGEELSENDREIIRELGEILGDEFMPEIFSRSMRPPIKPNPQDNLGYYRPGSRELFERTGDKGGFRNMGDFIASLLKDGQHDRRIAKIRADGQKIGVPSEGGFLVPDDFAVDFLELVTQTSPIMQRARVFPMNSETLKIPAVDDSNHSTDRAGLVAVWRGEGQVLSPDTIKTRQLELHAHKLTLLCKATREFLQDGLNADRFIRDTMVREAAWSLDSAFLRGTGAGMPLGMLTSPNLLVVSKEDGQEADTVQWENVLNLYQSLNPAATVPVWFASPSCKAQIFNMTVALGTAGVNYWPSLREATPKGMELFGFPVYFSEQMEILGDQGDILLAAPENYVIGLRQQVEVDVSPHVGFLTDEIYIRLTLRVDGQSACSTPLILRDGTTQVSDFVTLQAR
jgi:HK97 family phage major capsid protein